MGTFLNYANKNVVLEYSHPVRIATENLHYFLKQLCSIQTVNAVSQFNSEVHNKRFT